MPRNTANTSSRDTPRIRIRRIDAVHRAMQTSTATKRRRHRTTRPRARAVSVNTNSSRFSETSSVSSSGYDADRDFDAQSVASGSSSRFSQRAISELDTQPRTLSHAMVNAGGPFLHYFPGQSDAAAAAQYWDAGALGLGLDSSGNEAAEMDAELDSSSDSSSSSSSFESIPPLSLNPPSRRPLQPTLSTTIQSNPFLRAAKASGVVSNTNAEVDLVGGSVRLRVRDCHWVEAGEVRDMKMRWSRWSRKGKEMDVVNEEE